MSYLRRPCSALRCDSITKMVILIVGLRCQPSSANSFARRILRAIHRAHGIIGTPLALL